MNRRGFFGMLCAVIAAPWNRITKRITTRPGYKRILEQAFPKTWEELPGLYCHWINNGQVYPYLIVREFDEWNDTWNGLHLENPRRNKWFVKDVNGDVHLGYIDKQRNDDTGEWNFIPELLFFKKV